MIDEVAGQCTQPDRGQLCVAVPLDDQQLCVLAFLQQRVLDDASHTESADLHVVMIFRDGGHGSGQDEISPPGRLRELFVIRVDRAAECRREPQIPHIDGGQWAASSRRLSDAEYSAGS